MAICRRERGIYLEVKIIFAGNFLILSVSKNYGWWMCAQIYFPRCYTF